MTLNWTGFTGGRYPQTFVLADLAVDGLEPGTVNAYLSAAGPLLFFQLAEPATWRQSPCGPNESASAGAAA